MKVANKLAVLSLLLLAAVGVAGLFLTSESFNTLRRVQNPQAGSGENGLFNRQFLDTARRLSTLAATAEELPLAQDALRLADRELDMQFAAALQATAHAPAPRTPAVLAVQERIARIGKAIETKQGEVEGLTEAVKNARKGQRDSLEEQLDVAQAELDLYKEVLGDAEDDLIRAGGDPHSRIQQLVEDHKASSKEVDAIKLTPESAPSGPSSGSLVAKCSYWNKLRQKQNRILQARQEAYGAVAGLAKGHDALAQQVQNEQARRKSPAPKGSSPAAPGNAVPAGNAGGTPQGSAADAISSIKRLADDRKALGILGRRIQTLQNLGSDYNQWGMLVNTEKRQALHAVISTALWIIAMLLVMFLINQSTEHFFSRLTLEYKQRATLQAVIRITVRVATVLAILLVIFGPPGQLSTVLGLATAGLTVALKDFIVSFLGWFALMGRQGIHVGDQVEINGVRGEVIEITLLRTILLEMGTGADSGQPTGRQVAFLNQYSIEGYYFNFSTAGQWLWDELQIIIPRGQNSYALVEKIQAIVAKETEKSAQLAEREWQRVSQRYGVREFSARPTVNVRPTDNGVIAIVRYITAARERSEVRHRLNLDVVKLLDEGGEIISPAETAPPAVDAIQK